MEVVAEAMTSKLARRAWEDQMLRVIASVEAPDYDTQRLRGRLPWLTLAVCAMAGDGLAAVWMIWLLALADLWPLYWIALAICLLITLFLIGSVAQRRSNYPFAWETPEALIVRAAAVEGDERIAPLAPTQPSPADNALGELGARRVRRLYHPRASLDRRTLAGALIAVLIALSIPILVAFPVILAGRTAEEGWEALSVASPLATAATAGLILWWQRLPFGVVVSADGIRWRRALRRRRLRWDAAQALCVVERRDAVNRRSQRIYLLQGPDGALVWASRWVTHWTTWAQEPLPGEGIGRVDASDPAWRLCALAAARTGLPMRDLTATMNSLVTLAPRLATQWRSIGSSFIAPLGSAAHTRIMRLRASHLRRLRALTATLLALDLMLLAAGLGLLVAAPRAYGAQLAWAQRQAPIFRDRLTPASRQWADLSGNGPPIFEDAGNDSVMIGNFYGNFALAAPHVRDGVVGVTVHHVAGSEYGYDWEGLILRDNQAKNRALVFTISSDGMWTLDRMEPKFNDPYRLVGPDDRLISPALFTPVTALRQGANAVNRLAVIMRGANYTFFINGQYVGSYYDTQDTGDGVGVVAEGDSMLAGFSDFAVYPAPPSSALFPV